VQAVGQLVEFVEPGGDTNHAFAAVSGRFDLIHGGFHHVLEDDVVLGGAPFGHGVDLCLGLVDQVLNLAVLPVTELDDLGAGVDKPAQDGPLGHDFGVVACVGGRRYGLDQLVEVGRAADPVDFAALGQLIRDGDRVGGLTPAVQVNDRFIDGFVRRAVEVLAAEDFDDVRDGILGEHHAAQDGLLGGDVLRRLAAAFGSPGALDRIQMRN